MFWLTPSRFQLWPDTGNPRGRASPGHRADSAPLHRPYGRDRWCPKLLQTRSCTSFPALAPVMTEVILYTCPTCEESCSVAPDLVCLTSFAPPAGKSSPRSHRAPSRNSSCQPTFPSSSPEKSNPSKKGCKS